MEEYKPTQDEINLAEESLTDAEKKGTDLREDFYKQMMGKMGLSHEEIENALNSAELGENNSLTMTIKGLKVKRLTTGEYYVEGVYVPRDQTRSFAAKYDKFFAPARELLKLQSVTDRWVEREQEDFLEEKAKKERDEKMTEYLRELL